MVLHVLERASQIRGVDDVVAAIPAGSSDDHLAEVIDGARFRVVRGSEQDVLGRFVVAAREARADAVVRIGADCPLLSPDVSGRVLKAFRDCDYASNTLRRTFPRGLDTEVVAGDALARAATEAVDAAEREHVTPYLWRRPSDFRLVSVEEAPDRSGLRWTVDTEADLAFAAAIYDELDGAASFEVGDVLALLDRRPELLDHNRDVRQREVGA